MATFASFGVPYSVILYGEFTTLLVERTIGTGTSTETWILSLFGGGAVLTNATYEENMKAIYEDSRG